jgi:photosystem II stability/assembly factor-like uncharacterized protein
MPEVGWDRVNLDIPAMDWRTPGARGVGGVAVDRHTGDVIIGLNGAPWGLWRSGDAGKTWTRLDEPNAVVGGWVRSFSIRIDNDRPGRVAAFRVSPPGPSTGGGRMGHYATMGMTLDGGKTWTSRKLKGLMGLSGMIHGMVDWTKPDANVMVAQPRIRPKLSLSTDGGESWSAIGKIEGIFEPTPSVEFMKAKMPRNYAKWIATKVHGYGVWNGAILLGDYDGIKRRAIDGEKFETVCEQIVSAHTPVAFDGKLYWGGEKGVLVSDDDGASWSLLGSELPMVRKGPFFGASPDRMVVVTESGVFRTENAGRTWWPISPLKKDETAWRADEGPLWLRHDYAWDHTRNIVYMAGMAGTLHKLEVK